RPAKAHRMPGKGAPNVRQGRTSLKIHPISGKKGDTAPRSTQLQGKRAMEVQDLPSFPEIGRILRDLGRISGREGRKVSARKRHGVGSGRCVSVGGYGPARNGRDGEAVEVSERRTEPA